MFETKKATILRIKEVTSRTGLPRSSIYQKIAEKQFPEPINLGDRAVGWIESEVDAWVSSRITVSRGDVA